MPRTPLDLKPLPRPEMQRYDKCAAQGCHRTPRSYSRFCSNHARRMHDTRDPNGRAVRKSEIKPYIGLADEYLKRNAEHPAVVAAIEYLRASLGDTTLPGEIRRHMTRLRMEATEPRDMLLNFLGIWGLGHFMPHTVTSDACETFNIGNRVLRTSPMPTVTTSTGKRRPAKIPARVCEAYGQMLRDKIGVFAIQFWRHIDAELSAPARAARAVSDGLRAAPFGTSVPTDADPSCAESNSPHSSLWNPP